MFKRILLAYCTLLFLSAFPYSPVATNFNCDIVKRADFLFPARQIQCWLNSEVL
jgi:hypothetical protein